ncbi:MAG: [FeFe] hydrogenase H-cluster maturation GTPase HydF [Halanaerobiaceae bacterium]
MTSTFNSTPTAERPHIAVFGRRNAGKSTMINFLTDQDLALVSEVPGTTTDPVYKSMEVLPLGPVIFIDTAGIDDRGDLGSKRVEKTFRVIRKTDLALMIINDLQDLEYEEDLIARLEENFIPYLIIFNNIDNLDISKAEISTAFDEFSPDKIILMSDYDNTQREEILTALAELAGEDNNLETEGKSLIADLIKEDDLVLLIIPIDSGAPKDRLILPQMQTLRRILDNRAQVLVVRPDSIESALERLNKPPALAVTDSQAFAEVSKLVPEDILLTGFSILFARYKGDLDSYLQGANSLENLKPGMNILIAEACTHRKRHEDIGTVKIPGWLEEIAGGSLNFDHYAGQDFPAEIGNYDLAVFCGGCMINQQEVTSRIKDAREAGVPVINYGILIAWKMGILARAIQPFLNEVEVNYGAN